jgi:predicted amidophosphoribosyltransferase
MDSEKQPQSSQSETEASLLKQRNTFRHFMRECAECQQEVEPHWQLCSHCGTRLDTSCPGCGNPLPPAGASSCPSCGLTIPQAPL